MSTTAESLRTLSEILWKAQSTQSTRIATYSSVTDQLRATDTEAQALLVAFAERLVHEVRLEERHRHTIADQERKFQKAFNAILDFDADRPLMSDRNFAEGMRRRLDMLLKEGDEYFELPKNGFWGEVIAELGEVGEAEYKLQEVADLIIFAIQAMILEFLGKHSAKKSRFKVSVQDMQCTQHELARNCVLWAREQGIVIPGKRKKVRNAHFANYRIYVELSHKLEKKFDELEEHKQHLDKELNPFEQEYIRKSLQTVVELGVKVCWSLGMDWSQATMEKLARNAIRYPAGLFQKSPRDTTQIETYAITSRVCKVAHGRNTLPQTLQIVDFTEDEVFQAKALEGGTREFYSNLLEMLAQQKAARNS